MIEINESPALTIGHSIDWDARSNVTDDDLHLNSGYGIDAAVGSSLRTGNRGNRVSDNTLGVAKGQFVDQGENLRTSGNLIATCP